MGREVRMVPLDWEHPRDADGRFVPLMRPYGHENFDGVYKEWREQSMMWDKGYVQDWNPSGSTYVLKDASHEEYETAAEWYGDAPRREHYMPDFEPGTAVGYCMYEDTSEGTPISPVFEKPEELAHWLARTGASAFGNMTADYESWLATIKRGSAISMVITNGVIQSGVEAL